MDKMWEKIYRFALGVACESANSFNCGAFFDARLEIERVFLFLADEGVRADALACFDLGLNK